MKIFGIPVKVELSFLFIAVLLASSRLSEPVLLIEWVVVVFVSVLVHEFGHALVCRAFGLAPTIQLYGMGGLTSWTGNERVTPPKNIAISLAGPGAGFFFGGLVYLAGRFFPEMGATRFGDVLLLDLLWVNWGWGVFNLLPVLPLDGGHVVNSLEEWVTKRPVTIIAPAFSLLVAVGLALLALRANLTLVAILMAWFALINGGALYRQFHYYRDRRLRGPLDAAHVAFKNRDGAAVVRAAEELLPAAASDAAKREAQQLLVQGLILEGDLARAQQEAARLQAVHSPEAMQEALMRFQPEEWPRALPLLEPAYQSSLKPELGMMYAYALILAQRFDEVLPLIAEPRLDEYANGLYALLQQTALQAGAYEISIRAGEQAHARGASPHIAYNIARAHIRAGRREEALQWLDRAVAAGYDDVKTLATDPDFELLGDYPEFARLSNDLSAIKQ